MPVPNLPSPFIQLLLSKNLENLALAEELLCNNENSESLKNWEELISLLFACNKIIIILCNKYTANTYFRKPILYRKLENCH